MKLMLRGAVVLLFVGVALGGFAQKQSNDEMFQVNHPKLYKFFSSTYINTECQWGMSVGHTGLHPINFNFGWGYKFSPLFYLEVPIEYNVLLNSRNGAHSYLDGSAMGLNGVFSIYSNSRKAVQVLAGASLLNYGDANYGAYNVGTRILGTGKLSRCYVSLTARYMHFNNQFEQNNQVMDPYITQNFWTGSIGFGIYFDAAP